MCSVCSVGHSWIDQLIFFVDFEGSLGSGVLEYGVVGLLRGQIVQTNTRLCRPTGRVRREDTAVHGLDAEMLEHRTPFADEWEFFAGLRERGPLAAHFAGVENGLLKSAWPYPRSSPDFARVGERIIDWGPWLDSARIYQQLYPQFPSTGLETLIAGCGLQTELDRVASLHCPADRRRYHCALYDALGGALLLGRLSSEPSIAHLSMMQMMALSTLDGGKRDALRQRELF